jgi:hypothetical protein
MGASEVAAVHPLGSHSAKSVALAVLRRAKQAAQHLAPSNVLYGLAHDLGISQSVKGNHVLPPRKTLILMHMQLLQVRVKSSKKI